MVIVMPHLVAPIKREARFLLHYSRTRPRFKLHLAIDALLSIALALAAFHIVTAPSRQNVTDQLRISGAVAFTAEGLVKFIKEERLSAYWAGPTQADKYTVVATTPGEVTITYFPKNADIANASAAWLVVQTHSHFSASEAQAYSQDVSGVGSFLLNQGQEGNAIHYNPATPTRVTITFKKQFAAVTIFDSTPEASLTLAMKPGAIQKIS